MKNIILGWLFLMLGIGLNGWSLWTLAQSRAKAPPEKNRESRSLSTSTSSEASSIPLENTPSASMQPSAAPSSSGVKTSDMPAPPSVDAPPARVSEPPREANAAADAMGAPGTDANPAAVPAPPSSAATQVVLLFDHRSQSISPAIVQQLTQMAKENPDARFRMDVAAGEMKTADENEKLAKRRARAIRQVLQDAGIPERKVSYRLVVPGPEDGEPPKTSEEWRRATVRVARSR